MRLIRSRLVAVALALVVWQITGVAVAPVALCCVTSARAGGDEHAACTCEHEGGAICPMHKASKTTADPPSRETRWCTGSGNQADMIILTMLAASGGLPESLHRLVRPAAVSNRILHVAATLGDVTRPPVSPPPRG